MPLAAAAGLPDPVRSSQSVFRQVMAAMASPGAIMELEPVATSPPPLSPAAAAVVLTLADFETPLWLDAGLAAAPQVAEFLRFHTGAPIVAEAGRAMFAVAADPVSLPPLTAFAQGTLEYPDASATLVLQVEGMEEGSGLRLKGPGIDGRRKLRINPLPDGFVKRMRANRVLCPRGVDLILVAGSAVAALPRTTRVKD